MAPEILNNNLIARAITTKPIEQNIKQPEIKSVSKPDTFEKKETIIQKPVAHKETSQTAKIVNGIVSMAFFIGLFFLPEILFNRRTKANMNMIEQLKNFKPAIDGAITGNKQEILKNGKIKTTIESIKNNFKYNEIVIVDKGKIKQRILTKKEQMPNGKYILRGVKSYKGDNLIDNAEINKNEAKYLVKEFKRSRVKDKQYTTIVTRKGQKPEITLYHSTSNGEPVLKIKDSSKQKENMTFLYENDKCVGTDAQIIPKNSSEKQYNILTIPKRGINHKRYNFQKDGNQYDESLTTKLRENF